jgi:hypothetical protein
MKRVFYAALWLAGCHSAVRPDIAAPPGALLRCESSGKNAYDTYGDSTFSKIVQSIADDFKDEPAAFRGNLAAFLVWAYGGPDSTAYVDGKTYQAIYKNAGLTSAQYELFASHLIPAVISSGVKHGPGGGGRKNADDVKSCFAPPLLDPAFKASIAGQ